MKENRSERGERDTLKKIILWPSENNWFSYYLLYSKSNGRSVVPRVVECSC